MNDIYFSISKWLESLRPSDKQDNKEFDTGTIKIRHRSLIFPDSAYQISNISAIELVRQPINGGVSPLFLLVVRVLIGLLIVVAGLILLIDYIIIAIVLCFVITGIAFIAYSHRRRQVITAPTLAIRIVMNSGSTALINNSDVTFIKGLLETLFRVIENPQTANYNVNLDQRKITLNNSIYTGDHSQVGNISNRNQS